MIQSKLRGGQKKRPRLRGLKQLIKRSSKLWRTRKRYGILRNAFGLVRPTVSYSSIILAVTTPLRS